MDKSSKKNVLLGIKIVTIIRNDNRFNSPGRDAVSEIIYVPNDIFK